MRLSRSSYSILIILLLLAQWPAFAQTAPQTGPVTRPLAGSIEASPENEPMSNFEVRSLPLQKDDLAAQQKMAFWAMWMTVATAFAALFTLGSLVLLRAALAYTRETMGYTRETLQQTQKTLLEAEKSTAAAIRTAEIAEENHKATLDAAKAADLAQRAQIRPWLTLSAEFDGTIQFDLDGPGLMMVPLKFTCRNVGNSAARDATVAVHVSDDPVTEDWIFEVIGHARAEFGGQILAPSEAMLVKRGNYFPLSKDTMRAGNVKPRVFVIVTYRDVRGDEVFHTAKSYEVFVPRLLDDGTLARHALFITPAPIIMDGIILDQLSTGASAI